MSAISRGWTLTKQSWAVLRADRSLLIFPFVSTVLVMLAAAAIWLPTTIAAGLFESDTVNDGNPVWIAGAAWSVATFFVIPVIPVIALEGSGPWRSLKRSVEVVKARWGEGATGTAAITLVTALVAVPLVFIGLVGGYALFTAGQAPLAFLVGVVCIAVVVVVSIISSALNGIFRVAVYQYAATGQTPAGFDSQLVAGAFDGRTHRS